MGELQFLVRQLVDYILNNVSYDDISSLCENIGCDEELFSSYMEQEE